MMIITSPRMIRLLFIGILTLAIFFRFTGINWDQNQHLHPDERFLTMVAESLHWPDSFSGYLDTHTSPLNPHNQGSHFYVYGTFPVIFTKWVAELFNMGDYTGITIVGRFLSGLMDLGTAILVFLIAINIAKSKQPTTHNVQHITLFPFLAMFFYASYVLPIQLSHFLAVDTYLTFFITLSFYFLTKLFRHATFVILFSILLGVSFGLAVATKVSALYFAPIIGLGLLFYIWNTRKYAHGIFFSLLFSVFCFLSVRLALPYLFDSPELIPMALNNKVLNNWKELASFNNPDGGFPPSVQWITSKPYIFPLKNIIFYGLGFPTGVLTIIACFILFFSIFRLACQRRLFSFVSPLPFLVLSLLWIFALFAYQGGQFSKNMRYFLPLYPFLALVTAWVIVQAYPLIRTRLRHPGMRNLLGGSFILISLAWPLAFISIYHRPHSRVEASQWIYDNIPAGSRLAVEHWDDGLPLNVENHSNSVYSWIEFPLYGQDTPEKWNDMIKRLESVDYIILSSNRLYGSIMTLPQKYPITTQYYQRLFDGSLGFERVAEFTSRPNLFLPGIELCITPPFARYGIVTKPYQTCPLPGISIVDDYADESFTVYDHPKVSIFRKVRPVDYQTIRIN